MKVILYLIILMLGSYEIACIFTVCVLVYAGNNRILRTGKIIYSLTSTTTNRTSPGFIT